MSTNRYPGVYRRGKTWSFRAQFGDGDDRWGVSGSGYPTAKAAWEARNKAAEQARPLHGVAQRPDATLTLAEYLNAWVADHARTLKPTTRRTYQSNTNMICQSPVAQRRLRSLTATDYRNLIDDLKAQSPSHTTLVHKLGMLSRALNAAAEAGLIPSNPLPGIKVSRTGEKFQPKFWDVPTVQKFLNHRRRAHDPLYDVWHLAVVTGMRRGELHGLKKDDFDLDRGLVHVRRQRVAVVFKDIIEQSPKTEASEAPVYLDEATVDLIRRHTWTSDYFVNNPRTGRPYDYFELFTYDWNQACYWAGVPRIRFHDLRHTSASLLAAAGVPLVLAQARLRHWSPDMTARYTHAMTNMGAEVASQIGALVNGE